MSEKKIIAVIGMPGSGKSTVIQALVKKHNLPFIYFGGLTLEEVRRRGLEETQENEKKIRQEFREKYGMGAYAHLSLPKIKELLEKNDVMLIDGLYSWSEYILLKNANIGEVILLTVISKRKNRYERLQKRSIRPLTPEEAEKRDIAEIENLEKGGPIALCDEYFCNDGTMESLSEKIENFAKTLGV